jgi:hypothetical protein
MSQPNFLQVERSLRGAVAWVRANPAAPASRAYGEALEQAQALFATATGETDASYGAWRAAHSAELRAFKALRLAIEAAREQADEHGLDGCPTRSILYTERDDLQELSRETAAYLSGYASEWDWIAGCIAELERRSSAIDVECRSTRRLYEAYTVSIKRRVAAYGDAVGLLREFLADLRRDAGDTAERSGFALERA